MFARKCGIAALVCLGLMALPLASSPARAADDGSGIQISLSGGPMGGGASMALAAFMKAFLAEYPKAVMDLLPGNGTANPIRVSKGQVQVAHAQSALLTAAKNGTENRLPNRVTDVSAALFSQMVSMLTQISCHF